jgi:hypothetical protein
MPKMDLETLRDMQPSRPAELDRLAPFIGRWEGKGELKMSVLDEVLPMTGISENSWDCDGWCMVERDHYEMGDLGSVTDVSVWTWDAKARTFRIARFDSVGGAAAGTADYDERSQCWKLKSGTRTPWGKMQSRGTVRMVDEDTVEWTWDEWPGWDWLRLFKIAEMKGTNQRR